MLRFPELESDTQPHYLSTQDDFDKKRLDQMGVIYKSEDTSTMLTIPVVAKNNFTEIWCAVLYEGVTEFSEPIILTIVGKPLL